MQHHRHRIFLPRQDSEGVRTGHEPAGAHIGVEEQDQVVEQEGVEQQLGGGDGHAGGFLREEEGEARVRAGEEEALRGCGQRGGGEVVQAGKDGGGGRDGGGEEGGLVAEGGVRGAGAREGRVDGEGEGGGCVVEDGHAGWWTGVVQVRWGGVRVWEMGREGLE